MNIRECIIALENYYGKWNSRSVLEAFLTELFEYHDDEMERIYTAIIEYRPMKWGSPDVNSLVCVVKDEAKKQKLKLRKNSEILICPVCKMQSNGSICKNCRYETGDDIEKHRIWWEDYRSGKLTDLRFDMKKIVKSQ